MIVLKKGLMEKKNQKGVIGIILKWIVNHHFT